MIGIRNATARNLYAAAFGSKKQTSFINGAGDGIRTHGLNLGKVALCQLSYTRSPLCVF